ncbi:hypothetical protein JY97_12690 [Alkalispirochaeta odontotermitis]|nr:hypothetical protein JY97_12690 [Alkalispirochaeta odontotermitis]
MTIVAASDKLFSLFNIIYTSYFKEFKILKSNIDDLVKSPENDGFQISGLIISIGYEVKI